MSMFKTNIISKVEVEPITQEQIEQLIIDKFKDENPSVLIESITFTQRRDPARIEVTVDARLNTGAVAEPVIGNQSMTSPNSATALSKKAVIEEKLVEIGLPIEESLDEDEELDLLNLTKTPERVQLDDLDDDGDVGNIFKKV